eukprot:2129782-Rhodomonas_salina.1
MRATGPLVTSLASRICQRRNATPSAQRYSLSSTPLPQLNATPSAQRHSLSSTPLPQLSATPSAQRHSLSSAPLPQLSATPSTQPALDKLGSPPTLRCGGWACAERVGVPALRSRPCQRRRPVSASTRRPLTWPRCAQHRDPMSHCRDPIAKRLDPMA